MHCQFRIHLNLIRLTESTVCERQFLPLNNVNYCKKKIYVCTQKTEYMRCSNAGNRENFTSD